ncbi:lipoprotein [Hoeflea sp. YIM 152468]|uniref:LPS translocon maturation chaperone LptM n=1 Tax=Hoeflea sp. YIM 152468 TaxID=3031759 RepID=UPI0023DC8469|nr:lipoprotein [Hoeflea sp. YIM 152468]MDF1608046.1 lipoprotein [Hoeflea sp. YIM 152468]
MTTGPWIKTICAMALLGVVLTGCGRKGPLERPGVTPMPAAPGAEEPNEPVAPERRFILDGLLE